MAGRARPARPSPGRNSPTRSSTSPAGRTGNRPSTSALAPLALLRPGSRRLAWMLWGYAAYLFADLVAVHPSPRPVLAADPAGPGGPGRPRGRLDPALGLDASCWALILAVALVNEPVYDSSALAGLQRVDRRPGLPPARPARAAQPAARDARRRLPPDARVLLVGQAAVFHLEHPIVYNTVFNAETIEELATGKDSAAFRQALRDRELDPYLRRLAGDPAPSPAGRLRLHRFVTPRAVRGVGRRTASWSGPSPTARSRSSTASADGQRPGRWPAPGHVRSIIGGISWRTWRS